MLPGGRPKPATREGGRYDRAPQQPAARQWPEPAPDPRPLRIQLGTGAARLATAPDAARITIAPTRIVSPSQIANSASATPHSRSSNEGWRPAHSAVALLCHRLFKTWELYAGSVEAP